MPSRRDLIRMTDAEVRAYLASQRRIILVTNGADGMPLPLPMKIPVFCAGALEIRARSFIAVVALARFIRYFALAYLGQRYGRDTLAFLRLHWPTVVFVVLALCIVAVVLLRFVNRKQPEIPEGISATGSE